MVQRRPLGDAAAPLSAHDRVPLAGGPHRARDRSGSARRNEADARRLRNVRARSSRDSGFQRREIARANVFPAPCRRFASRPWCRTGKRSRPARRISSGRIFRAASGIKFQTRDGKQEFGWTTSWGMSTRLVGTLIMAHADDDGLILPPRIAPTQIVIVPVTPKEETRAAVLEAADKLAAQLRAAELCRRADRSGSGPPRSRRRRQELGMDQERRAVARRARSARSGVGQRRRHPPRSAGKVEGVPAHGGIRQRCRRDARVHPAEPPRTRHASSAMPTRA